MKVNLTETKIVIFRKGGKTARNDVFFCNKNPVEVVNSYTYLSVPFQTTGIFEGAAGHFKAKRYAALGAATKRIKNSRYAIWNLQNEFSTHWSVLQQLMQHEHRIISIQKKSRRFRCLSSNVL